jgi:hypothetical protein
MPEQVECLEEPQLLDLYQPKLAMIPDEAFVHFGSSLHLSSISQDTVPAATMRVVQFPAV